MSETHIIRLRGPWEYEPLARTFVAADGARRESTEELPPAGRVRLPCDWGMTLGTDFRGRVRYSRRFGLPTNLEPQEQVWLLIDGVDYFGMVSLNGQPLGDIAGYMKPAEFAIRRILADRNVLTLDIELPRFEPGSIEVERPCREHLPGGPIGEVRLEIRS